MQESTITLTLAIEELLFVLRLLEVDFMPGLPEKPWAEMPDEQSARALVAAERSLRARGLIHVREDERRVDIDPVLTGLVAACLIPRYSLLAIFQQAGQDPETRYYHVTQDLSVEHASPGVGLHSFTASSAPEAQSDRLLAFIKTVKPEGSECLSGQIREADLRQAQAISQSGSGKAAEEMLSAAGMTAPLAQALAQSLSEPAAVASFVRVSSSNGKDSKVSGLALLAGAERLWLVTPEEDQEEGWVSLETISRDRLEERLRTLLER